MKLENRPLGRGLADLLQDASGSSCISEIAIDAISPNLDQPRRNFDPESLEELAQSIASIGLVQPVTVKQQEDGSYMLISGERRWRACKKVGLTTIPAYIKTATQEEVMEMALIENIQREDLNAIEIALAYHQLLQNNPNAKHEDVAKRVGKTRSSVTNYIRLLKLPAEIQLGLTERKIEMGHARAILGLPHPQDQLVVYAQTVEQHLSVRDVEMLIRRICKKDPNKRRVSAVPPQPNYTALNKQLSQFFGCNTKIATNEKGRGTLTIKFANDAELARIIEILDLKK